MKTCLYAEISFLDFSDVYGFFDMTIATKKLVEKEMVYSSINLMLFEISNAAHYRSDH